MRTYERLIRTAGLLGVFGVASFFAVQHGTGGLWRGFEIAHAVTSPGRPQTPYDLTELVAVNETLHRIRSKYVDPQRIKPRQMFLSALNEIQKEVAQIIILHEEKASTVRVQVENEFRDFHVDNVQGPWDVSARLREVFVFLQDRLKKDAELDLREVEYAACNGMLRTLDPHSVFLSPEAYREMNMSTSGHFGGLGIVISLRDQQLTVMRPMPDTPAGRGGLKRFDRITKINNESTLNMPLDDAVRRLRGKPGSRVTVWIHRDGPDGWKGSRPFDLVREEIAIRSVMSRALPDGTGYVRIKTFQATTTEELQQALGELQRTGSLRGLVLDLRGNPGGLLDQAARVADLFLEDGVIVSTVGGNEGREEKKATRDGDEPKYPIVLLINGTSASASEIVAGALKHLDRSVLVGEATFGKGTVQLVYPGVTPDGAALKLTIAQYLMPGDISIQGVGVTPDVVLDPMTADPLEMDLYRSEWSIKERDLSKSLASGGKHSIERPSYTLRYQLPEAERLMLRELGDNVDDDFRPEYTIEFGRSLVAAISGNRRTEQLKDARVLVERAQRTQIEAISGDLAKLGIDWRAAPANAPPGPRAADWTVQVGTDRKENTVRAGESLTLQVTVQNRGTTPAYQLRAITKSDSAYFDEKELVFGRIEPGQSRTATVPLGFCEIEGRKVATIQPLSDTARRVCRIPLDSATRQDVVKVRFSCEGGEAPADVELRPIVRSLPRPVFAYSYHVVDNRPGNGNGQLERGEGATIYLTVRNAGTGPSYETQANLRNLTGDGLLLHGGRFDISNMKPGEERSVELTFDVLDTLAEDAAKVELSVVDRDLRVIAGEKLSLPVVRGGYQVKSIKDLVRLASSQPVLPQPAVDAAGVGDLESGSVLERLGTFGEFSKVRIRDERFGWVKSAALTAAPGATPGIRFRPWLLRSPPLLEVEPQALSTTQDKIHIKGIATDSDRVLDVFVFVGDRKVFYRARSGSADARRLPFELDAALKPGMNVITVVARENHDTATRTTLVVRRDGPSGVPLPTPKSDWLGEDWGSLDDSP